MLHSGVVVTSQHRCTYKHLYWANPRCGFFFNVRMERVQSFDMAKNMPSHHTHQFWLGHCSSAIAFQFTSSWSFVWRASVHPASSSAPLWLRGIILKGNSAPYQCIFCSMADTTKSNIIIHSGTRSSDGYVSFQQARRVGKCSGWQHHWRIQPLTQSVDTQYGMMMWR